MWVVKLGGSLALSPELPLWLNALAATDAVIVPGGGPFADSVRIAQSHWCFDEQTAHDMAILGMHQYGRMLAGLNPALGMVSGLSRLQSPAVGARIWLPLPEELNARGVPASWEISSDSLAAWLAGSVGADQVLLVKSAKIPPGRTERVEDLSRSGMVDAALSTCLACGKFTAWLGGADLYGSLPEALGEPASYFTRIGV